jgi:hypothetical protein
MTTTEAAAGAIGSAGEGAGAVEPRGARPPEARQFDFWLGSWDLTWAPDGRGVNEVRSILEDRVVLESFDGRPSIPLAGMSVSVYDEDLGRWRQTWADSAGSYLDFVGGLDGDQMILDRILSSGRRQRMVWSNIEAESLHWSWEWSDDEGRTWTVAWAIEYRRRPLGGSSEPSGP